MTVRASYTLDVVVPCYDEEEALPQTIPAMLDYFRKLAADLSNGIDTFRIILVDDGSSDDSWPIIVALAEINSEITGVKLSRNFGHQAAMLAGLSLASADTVVTMDCDLQDDLQAIRAMVAAFENGAHLALGIRADRSSDTMMKHGSASLYYRLLKLLGVEIVHNHADYRLMSRTALGALLAHREVNLFLRGIIPSIGFPVAMIPYHRRARTSGTSKYTLRKMIGLGLDGITSFSVTPLRMISVMGALVFLGTTVTILAYLYLYLTKAEMFVPGWASTVLPILLLGGLQLLSMGIVGEYIGKMYLETKQRPRYLIEEIHSRASDVQGNPSVA